MNTLIVEDEFMTRKIMKKIVSSFSDIDIATDGDEAIEAFKLAHENKEAYDLILLDIMMPGKNGQEVLKVIREYEEEHSIYNDTVKVIMTTALGDSKNVMEAFRQQCEGYIVKPVIRKDLISKIGELGFKTE